MATDGQAAKRTSVETKKGLNDRRSRFVDEYLTDLNATQAAIRAGYSPKNAAVEGSRLLNHTPVQTEIRRRRAKLAERLGITAERVVAEIAKIAFANMSDYVKIDEAGKPQVDFSRLQRDQAAGLTDLAVEFFKEGSVRRLQIKLDKRRALWMLAKHLGLFNSRAEPRPEDDPSEIKVDDLSLVERLQRLAWLSVAANDDTVAQSARHDAQPREPPKPTS